MENKTIKEIENMVLNEIKNWWDIYDIDTTDDGYISAVYMEVPEMNMQARVMFPCGATNFYFLLNADYMDYFNTWDETAISCWYELDELLEDLKSTKVHEKIFDAYDRCSEDLID